MREFGVDEIYLAAFPAYLSDRFDEAPFGIHLRDVGLVKPHDLYPSGLIAQIPLCHRDFTFPGFLCLEFF